MYRSYYGDVTKVEKEGERGVRFRFKSADNRELPQILGQMPVLSKKYWSGRDFAKTTLEAPLGSGPYKIEAIDPGRSITYRRVADYWAADLPVNKGRYNVDTIRYDYYRDGTIALEAFKAGQYDVRQENSSKSWATGYDSPALRDGLIKKEEIPNQLPSGMQGFGYNLRRPLFQDPRVRQALGLCLRFRMVEQEPVLRRLQADPQLFRQFRAGRDRGAAGRRAEDPRTVPRQDPGRGVHQGIRSAEIRRLRQYPRRAARGAEAAEGGRLELQGRKAGQRQDRPAVRVRDPARRPAVRAHRAALRKEPGAHGDHRARAHGRYRAIRKAHGDVRLRHGGRRRSASRCRRATSSASIGDRKPPTSRAAATSSASRARSSTS